MVLENFRLGVLHKTMVAAAIVVLLFLSCGCSAFAVTSSYIECSICPIALNKVVLENFRLGVLHKTMVAAVIVWICYNITTEIVWRPLHHFPYSSPVSHTIALSQFFVAGVPLCCAQVTAPGL